MTTNERAKLAEELKDVVKDIFEQLQDATYASLSQLTFTLDLIDQLAATPEAPKE